MFRPQPCLLTPLEPPAQVGSQSRPPDPRWRINPPRRRPPPAPETVTSRPTPLTRGGRSEQTPPPPPYPPAEPRCWKSSWNRNDGRISVEGNLMQNLKIPATSSWTSLSGREKNARPINLRVPTGAAPLNAHIAAAAPRIPPFPPRRAMRIESRSEKLTTVKVRPSAPLYRYASQLWQKPILKKSIEGTLILRICYN